IPPVGLHLQGRPIMSNGFVNLTLLKKDKPDISMSHPAFRVPSQSGAPKRFSIGVRAGLPQRPRPMACYGEQRSAHNHGAVLRKFTGQTDQARAKKGDRTDACEILI